MSTMVDRRTDLSAFVVMVDAGPPALSAELRLFLDDDGFKVRLRHWLHANPGVVARRTLRKLLAEDIRGRLEGDTRSDHVDHLHAVCLLLCDYRDVRDSVLFSKARRIGDMDAASAIDVEFVAAAEVDATRAYLAARGDDDAREAALEIQWMDSSTAVDTAGRFARYFCDEAPHDRDGWQDHEPDFDAEASRFYAERITALQALAASDS